MGAISVKNFDISFISRTKEILEKYENYSGELEFTLLINTLIGLILLPREFANQGKRNFKYDFLKKELSTFPKLTEIFKVEDVEIYYENGESYNQKKFSFKSGINQSEIPPGNITLEKLLERLRHGIAHMHIIPTQFDGNWDGIIIRNFKGRRAICNFEAYLTYKELKEFAHFIASKYASTIKV